jgi:N-acetylglucosaminyldiphosphoundecaprenol N-acetyl-beta-D-mannosaminyltransferase
MIGVTNHKKLEIFGVPITQLKSYQHAEDMIVQRVRDKQKTFCVAINPEKIYRSLKDAELRELINSADFHICDGIGAAIAAQILHGQKVGRVTGVQLFYNLMERSETEGLKIFLLGASPDSNKGSCENLRQMHPNLQIVGNQDGYFEDDHHVIKQINDSEADMLFVAMGSPCQERWIAKHFDHIDATYCMGVGGTFDVVSGNVKWAPKIFRKTGTEFLYRFACEPVKRWRREIVRLKFAFKVLLTRLLGSRP